MEQGTYFKINNIKKFYNQLKNSEFIFNGYSDSIIYSKSKNPRVGKIIDATYVLIPQSLEKESQVKKDAKNRLIKLLEKFKC